MAKVNIKDDMKDKAVPLPYKEGALVEDDLKDFTPMQISPPTKLYYNIDTNEDGSISEYYEGSVEDIIRLIRTTEQKELIYNQEDAIDFIKQRYDSITGISISKEIIQHILELEEDYMRSVGIIED